LVAEVNNPKSKFQNKKFKKSSYQYIISVEYIFASCQKI